MDVLTIASIGALVGLLTGLVPGLHVNTLAALAAAALPSSPAVALALVAAGTVHTIVNIIPSTYLGAPDEDDVLVVLPAHRMLLDGDGPTAILASVTASLAALVAVVAAAPLYAFALEHGLHRWAADTVVPLLLAAVALLVAQEAWRKAAKAVWAVAVLGLSGALGLFAPRVPLEGLAPVDPTHLLPMLGGLFGVAGILVALRRPPPVPWQSPARSGRLPLGVWAGAGAAAITALLPGLSSSVAAATIPRAASPRRAVAALSAINTAHALFALLVVMSLGRVRTGLADALAQARPLDIWSPVGPTTSATQTLSAVLAAGIIGAVGTLLLSRIVQDNVHRAPARLLSGCGLASIVAVTAWITGWGGLVLLAVSAAVGLLPLRVGIRRVHLVGCLILPALVRNWP